MGPQHPSTHGVLHLLVTLEGELIVDVVPDVGFLHRGVEKIGENRTYAQFIPYTDRLDYVSPASNTLAYMLAAEKLGGIEVPERASYIRVIIAELNRIASHLVWLGTFALDLGAWSVFLYCFREREPIMDLLEACTGARMTQSWFRLGGLPADIPDGFAQGCRTFCREIRPRLDENDALFTGNRVFIARSRDIGILPAELGINYGVSGPSLRGSGVAFDVRKDLPYCVYDQLDFDVAVQGTCDVLGRYLVRVEEMRQSLRLIEQALEQMPEGEVMGKVPRAFRPAKGEAWARVESPRGDYGVWLVSDASANPARVRIRAPSFANLAALPVMARGWKVADLVAILGSLDIVLGEVDR